MFPESVFKDEQHRARVARALCELVGLDGLWTAAYGPTEKGKQQLATSGDGMTAGQKVMFLAAWEVWSGERPSRRRCPLAFLEILETLDGQYLRPIADLMVAFSVGPSGVDDWLARYERVAAVGL